MNRVNQNGFTLIEQLITLALSALLLAGIASSVTAIIRAQNLIRDYSGLQENLNFITAGLARSARTAHSYGKPNGDKAEDKKLIISTTDLEKVNKSCIGSVPDKPYIEIYSIENNNLVCEVDANSENESEAVTYAWEGKEVLAYGVSGFSFECAEYNAKNPIAFVACKNVSVLGKVIALKIDLTLVDDRFLEVKESISHSFVVHLRDVHVWGYSN